MEDLEGHPTARPVGGDEAGEVVGADHPTALDREDRVAADPVGDPLEAEFVVAPLQPGPLRRAVGDDFGDQPAVVGLEADYGGLIAEVVADGPAERAGLQGGDDKLRFQGIPYRVGGDTILAVEGRRVIRPDDLARFISSYRPGRRVTLEILHDGGGKEDVEVALGERPDGDGG